MGMAMAMDEELFKRSENFQTGHKAFLCITINVKQWHSTVLQCFKNGIGFHETRKLSETSKMGNGTRETYF